MPYQRLRAPVPGTRFANVACDECERALEPARGVDVDDQGRWDHLQARGALHLTLSGGYEGFIDPLPGERLEVLLCADCAGRLAQQVRCIGRLIAAHAARLAQDLKHTTAVPVDMERIQHRVQPATESGVQLAAVADVHGRWHEAAAFAQQHGCEAILVAGDLGEPAYSAPWPLPTFWIWGDDDSRLVWRYLRDAGQVQQCHLIPDWTTVSVGGLVILGVGAELDTAGRPGPAVTPPCPGPVPDADVVLSHAAGWHGIIASGSRQYDIFDVQVERAIRESGARLAFSGHHHRWLIGRTNHRRTRCYGLGQTADGWAVLDTERLRVSRAPTGGHSTDPSSCTPAPRVPGPACAGW